MFLNILETIGLILAYGFIGTAVTKIGWWILEEEGNPIPLIVGAAWPVGVPFVLAVAGAVSVLIGICYLSSWLIDKVTSSIAAMWEEWIA